MDATIADPLSAPLNISEPASSVALRVWLLICSGLFVLSLCLPVNIQSEHMGPFIGLVAWLASLTIAPLNMLNGGSSFVLLATFLAGVGNLAFIRATFCACTGRPVKAKDHLSGAIGLVGAVIAVSVRRLEPQDIASYLWLSSLVLWTIGLTIDRLQKKHRTTLRLE